MIKISVMLLKQRGTGDDRAKNTIFMRDLNGMVKREGRREGQRLLLNRLRKILINGGKVIARQEEYVVLHGMVIIGSNFVSFNSKCVEEFKMMLQRNDISDE